MRAPPHPACTLFLNPLSPVGAANMYMDVGLPTGAWTTYQGPQARRKQTHLPEQSYTTNSSSRWLCEPFLYPCCSFKWFDHVQVLYDHHGPCEIMHATPLSCREKVFCGSPLQPLTLASFHILLCHNPEPQKKRVSYRCLS